MKKSLIAGIMVVLLAILPAGLASDFDVIGSDLLLEACPSTTALTVLTVTNNAGASESFTVSLSGSAANWAVAAPAGFVLDAGETEAVYIYVTPAVSALVGQYDLDVLVSGSDGGAETFETAVLVKDCHGIDLTAVNPTQSACASTLVTFELSLENKGLYVENYDLLLDGNAAEWASLSESMMKLDAGEIKDVMVYVSIPYDADGGYALTLTAKSKNSNALDSQELGLEVEGCYDYTITAEKNFYEFCEHSTILIPMTLENQGTVNNEYELAVDGPSWAGFENDLLTVTAGSSATTNLVLFPGYGVSGDFPITIKAISTIGDVIAEGIITANVLTCHVTDLSVSRVADEICPGASKDYELSLKNAGTFDESYAISLDAPDWVTVDKSFVDLSAGDSDRLNLKVSPSLVVTRGVYDIKVIALAQDEARTFGEADMEITVTPSDGCFGVETTAALGRVEVPYGEGALVPITVENKGTEEVSYNLDVSGTGASFAQLNPATLTLRGGTSDTVYLYISIPEQTELGAYVITVSARLADGVVSDSATISIKVVEPGIGTILPDVDIEDVEIDLEPEEEEEEEDEGGILSTVGAVVSGATGKVVGVKDKIVGMAGGVTSLGARALAIKDRISAPSISDIIPDSLSGYLHYLAYWKYIALGLVFVILVMLIWNSGLLEKFDEFLEEEEEEKPAPKKTTRRTTKKTTKKKTKKK